MGHEVEVLTGFPCYPQGKLYDGYKLKWLQREIIDGIPVTRLPLYPSHDQSAARRMLYYSTLSLAMSVIGPWVTGKADVAYVHHGPATLGLPAIIFKWFKRIPFVYNMQDMWPDALANFGCNKALVWLTGQGCKIPYHAANQIVTQSPGFKEELVRRGVRSDKIEYVYNWCDESSIKTAEYDPDLAEKMKMKGKFNILHAGAMGKVQGLSSVIDAANLIKDKLPNVQFVFIGDGIARKTLEKKVADLKLSNVIFHDRVPPSEIGSIMALADVMLVHLTDTFMHSIAIPSKTQTYLAVGKPVLGGIKGDAADLIEKSGAGISCMPENPEKMADAVQKFYDMPKETLQQMGRRGADFYKSELSMSRAVKEYEEIFKKLVKKA